MATVTIFASSDGYILSASTGYGTHTYSQVRAGVNLVASSPNSFRVGQSGDSDFFSPFGQADAVGEGFLSFDTSAVTNPSAVVLSLYTATGITDNGPFIVEARLHDWGTTLTTADWVAGADLSSKTLLASYDRSVGYSPPMTVTFTESGSAFASNLNLLGYTRILLSSDQARLGNPTGYGANGTGQHLWFSSVKTAGTTQDPKIVVTYTAVANTKTISAAGGNWNNAATWNEGSIPTSADNVVATPSSGNLTINVAAACRSIDLTGYTGILTHNGFTLSVGDASGGKLKFVPSMTYTPVAVETPTAIVKFVATSDNGGAGWPITMGGKSFQKVEFDGAGGKWTFQDTFRAINTGSGGGPP